MGRMQVLEKESRVSCVDGSLRQSWVNQLQGQNRLGQEEGRRRSPRYQNAKQPAKTIMEDWRFGILFHDFGKKGYGVTTMVLLESKRFFEYFC